MIYERLSLMRDLLAVDGSIYVHCDWRVNGFIRLVMDEIFGSESFLNHITWKRTPFAGSSKARANKFPINQDSIFLYSRNSSPTCSINSMWITQMNTKSDSNTAIVAAFTGKPF
jgi:site-specific DNA-methyltransferase (adenine-specific)/adenine-specific DNA-methyltransferase